MKQFQLIRIADNIQSLTIQQAVMIRCLSNINQQSLCHDGQGTQGLHVVQFYYRHSTAAQTHETVAAAD